MNPNIDELYTYLPPLSLGSSKPTSEVRRRWPPAPPPQHPPVPATAPAHCGSEALPPPQPAALARRSATAWCRNAAKRCGKISGWWLSHPSEKYESQLGLLFPIYGKINNVPNHQPDMIVV